MLRDSPPSRVGRARISSKWRSASIESLCLPSAYSLGYAACKAALIGSAEYVLEGVSGFVSLRMHRSAVLQIS